MLGGISALRVLEIVAAAVTALLGLFTLTVFLVFRKDIIKVERQKAKEKLGLVKPVATEKQDQDRYAHA